MKQIYYVSQLTPIPNKLQELRTSLNYNIIHISSVYDLLPLISNPNFHIDMVVFDLAAINGAFLEKTTDIISTVITLLKCTLQRSNSSGTHLRKVSVVISIKSNCDHDLIRDISYLDIDGIYPDDAIFSSEEKEDTLRHLLLGEKVIPIHFKNIIKPSKKLKAKNPDDIDLTPRQAQIVKLICERGASNKVIAKLLNISLSTVKLHVTTVLKKYKAKNRTQLVLFATKQAKVRNKTEV